jgi:predicted membrane channel-forming protein YqfA (hemolysin III family)
LHRAVTAPDFMIDNMHLQIGYRGVLTPAQCMRSLFQLHNESCNIYSHAMGSLWMAHLWPQCNGDLALQLHSAAGTGLFAISAVAHLFAPVSRDCNATLFRLDRCGISVTETLLGVSTALIHFDAPHQRRMRLLTAGANVALGMAALRMLWKPESPNSSRLLKVGVLFAQGFAFSFPAFREFFRTRDAKLKRILVKFSILAAGCGFLGAFFYASFFPERLIYRRELEENARRVLRKRASEVEMALVAQQEGGSSSSSSSSNNSSLSPLSSSAGSAATLAAAAATPVLSTTSASKRMPPLPALLQLSRFWRLVHWLTNHIFHSHHLMHCSVVLATHFAFRLCQHWRARKLELASAAAAAIKQTIVGRMGVHGISA